MIKADLVYDYEDTVRELQLPDVDVIVCLAGGKGRIRAAGDLWYQYAKLKGFGRVPVLYVSGMGPYSNWDVLKNQISDPVLAVLQEKNVVLENISSNTLENARWFARHAQAQGWKHILLLTSSYHMKRARYIFEQVLNQGSPYQIETFSIYLDPYRTGMWRWDIQGIHVTMLEFFKWLYTKVVQIA